MCRVRSGLNAPSGASDENVRSGGSHKPATPGANSSAPGTTARCETSALSRTPFSGTVTLKRGLHSPDRFR